MTVYNLFDVYDGHTIIKDNTGKILFNTHEGGDFSPDILPREIEKIETDRSDMIVTLKAQHDAAKIGPWIDVNSDEIVTVEQLQIEFNALKGEYPEEFNYDFSEYIKNCLVENNGSLEPLE